MGIDDPYTAWCFDEAAHAWGLHVEGELRTAEKGAKNDQQRASRRALTFKRIFGEKAAETGKKQFRDPADLIGKK